MPKSKTSVTLTRTSVPPMRQNIQVLEYYAGASDEPAYNTEGCSLEAQAVIVRTSAFNPFILAIKLGENWHAVTTIQPDDPAVLRLADEGVLTGYGPSPTEMAKREAKEADAAARYTNEIDRAAARKERAESLRAQAEAETQRRREEQRSRMGMEV